MEKELQLLRELEASVRGWLFEASDPCRLMVEHWLQRLDRLRNPTEEEKLAAYRTWHNECHNPAYRKNPNCRICTGKDI